MVSSLLPPSMITTGKGCYELSLAMIIPDLDWIFYLLDVLPTGACIIGWEKSISTGLLVSERRVGDLVPLDIAEGDEGRDWDISGLLIPRDKRRDCSYGVFSASVGCEPAIEESRPRRSKYFSLYCILMCVSNVELVLLILSGSYSCIIDEVISPLDLLSMRFYSCSS